MPEVAANVTEAVLSSWNVPVGSPFAAGDTLVTVETDKAIVDVGAESSGVVLRHLVGEGTEVEVGSPIAVYGGIGEVVDDLDAFLAQVGVAAAQSQPGGAATTEEPAAVAPRPAPAPSGQARSRVFASPLARRLASQSGIDLAELTGSGPGGRVRRRDVEAYLAARPTPAREPATARPSPGAPAATAPEAAYVDVPNTRVRTAIAARLTESKQTAPHFYLRGSARVDRLLELRQEANAGGALSVSVNDLLLKAVGRAHVLVPALNVIWRGESVRHFSQVDVGMAVATEHGLVTPVVRGVDRLSLRQLSEVTKDLAARAKTKTLQQSELEGGTVSVTNLGMFGTEEFAAIINPPQSAILAVGAARQEPVVVDGALEVGTVLRVTLSVDHRAVDGATAAEWMKAFLGLLQNPVQILV